MVNYIFCQTVRLLCSLNLEHFKVTERLGPLSAPWAEFQMVVGCGTRYTNGRINAALRDFVV